MHKSITTLCVAAVFAACNPPAEKKTEKMKAPEKETQTNMPAKDTTPRVTGIGGIFFYSENPKQTNAWYAKNLGIDINDWGSAGFDYRSSNNPDEVISLQWKAFKNGDAYFSPSKKDFMINYTVQNLEGLLEKLRANGVTILDTLATYDYGKFVHIMDGEGNKIELWEPK